MKAKEFLGEIQKMGITTLAGVPDSALKPFCDYINIGGGMMRHYVTANEGAAVGMAIGSYLATGKASCIYMQNSGIGNVVNPITSLANEAVYGIPMLMLIGWRGEPGKKDEPQHKFMGGITEDMLKVLEIEHVIIGSDTSQDVLGAAFERAKNVLDNNRQFAFVIKKDFFEVEEVEAYTNNYQMIREEAIREIISRIQDEDVVVSTTGKISREVYEQSDMVRGQHAQEFLTVGGMGHTSMIALGIAEARKDKRVYCLDGDGAVLMHMGSLAFIGKQNPGNLIHICLNNEAHESVGGMPTGSVGLQYAEVAKNCGYSRTYRVNNMQELQAALSTVQKEKKLSFIEIRVGMYSRSDLGRPKETAVENKDSFMKYHGVRR